MSNDFVPTHTITTAGRSFPVMSYPADEPGEILYTREEWDSESTADWTYDPDRGLLFQGEACYTDGTTIEKIAPTATEPVTMGGVYPMSDGSHHRFTWRAGRLCDDGPVSAEHRAADAAHLDEQMRDATRYDAKGAR